jgi:L-asparaginase II
MNPLNKPELLIKVNRGAKLESEHRAVVALANSGGLVSSWGDASRYVYSRSLIKPIQAKVSLDFIRAGGRNLSDKQIAIASASHHAEAEHIAVIDSIVQDFGLDKSKIACVLAHNCSGKHSAILAACSSSKLADNYLAADHEYSLALQRELQRLGMDASTYSYSDGCGLQTFFMPLSSLATIFARMISDDSYQEIITAMNKYPSLIATAKQFDSLLMANLPNRFIAKTGAEGLMMVANLDLKQALIVKVLDGGKRAKAYTAATVMKELEWIPANYDGGLEAQINNAQGLSVGELSC